MSTCFDMSICFGTKFGALLSKNLSFLIILLLTNQSGISSNAARESSTASSHMLWDIYWSGKYIIKEEYKETTMSHISWVLYWYWSGIE